MNYGNTLHIYFKKYSHFWSPQIQNRSKSILQRVYLKNWIYKAVTYSAYSEIEIQICNPYRVLYLKISIDSVLLLCICTLLYFFPDTLLCWLFPLLLEIIPANTNINVYVKEFSSKHVKIYRVFYYKKLN